jgi:seryl-tRNA synthetase
MLDLHYVRENLETVKNALRNRNFPTESLDDFVIWTLNAAASSAKRTKSTKFATLQAKKSAR